MLEYIPLFPLVFRLNFNNSFRLWNSHIYSYFFLDDLFDVFYFLFNLIVVQIELHKFSTIHDLINYLTSVRIIEML
jgi:hypothetical protein